MITQGEKEQINLLLLNWMRWRTGSRGGALSPFPAYNLAPPGKRGETAIPVLTLDAEDVEDVLRDMPGYYRRVLTDYGFGSGDVKAKARRAKVSRSAYYRKLDVAYEMFWSRWVNRRDLAKRRHDTQIEAHVEAVSRGVKENA